MSTSVTRTLPSAVPAPRPEPPAARAVPRVTTLHGDTRIDEYFWLRNREDPEVLAYLANENAYTDAVMRLNNIIPAAVVTYLEHQGLPVRTDIVSEVNESFARAWGQGSDWPAG